jgi:pyroglutamyl-peptidase
MRVSRPSSPPVLLLTGFEPFGGDLVNPSWEIAKRLDGWEVEAADAGLPAPAVVRSVLLPCVFQQALSVLDDAIARHRPIAVIGLGLAASRQDISVERVAINVDDARIPDNAGCQPIDEPVCAGAPVAYWSTLPIKAIVSALQEAGISASVSQSAGTFVCNHVFFGLAHRLARQRRRRIVAAAGVAGPPGAALPREWARGGFIHVPWPLADDGSLPMTGSAMNLQTMVDAIRIAILVTMTVGESDARLPGGSLD